MGVFTAIYYNYAAVGGTLSGGGWEPSLPLTNMLTIDLGQVARSLSAATAHTQFALDLGLIRTVGGIAIGPTNMSPGSQYRIRSYDDQAMTDLLYDSGIKQIQGVVTDSLELEWENPGFWYGVEDIDAIFAPWIVEIIPAAQFQNANAQYWLVEIFDALNSQGFIEIGHALFGLAFTPSLNYDENNSFSRVDLVDVIESLGGHRDYWHRGSRRALRVSWWRLDEEEGWDDIYRMMTNLGLHEPMFVVPDPDDADNLQKRSFFATFRNSPELRLIIADGVTTGFEVEEVL